MGGHLSEVDRYHISALVGAGKSQGAVAKKLKLHRTTIYREKKRNSGKRGYRPKQAQEKATARWQGAVKAIKVTAELRQVVEERIRLDWSPEQISGRLAREGIFRG